VETHGPNGEYERAYREWVASLTVAELDALKANGLHKPLRDNCTHRPDYSSALNRAHDSKASGDDERESTIPITNESERLAMILLFLADSDNPRLELFTLMWLLGFTSMIGLSQEAVAARFGLSKAAFSKRCLLMQARFQLPPNRAMKSKKSCETYRLTNGQMPTGATKRK
jgi:hypothetical protein